MPLASSRRASGHIGHSTRRFAFAIALLALPPRLLWVALACSLSLTFALGFANRVSEDVPGLNQKFRRLYQQVREPSLCPGRQEAQNRIRTLAELAPSGEKTNTNQTVVITDETLRLNQGSIRFSPRVFFHLIDKRCYESGRCQAEVIVLGPKTLRDGIKATKNNLDVRRCSCCCMRDSNPSRRTSKSSRR